MSAKFNNYVDANYLAGKLTTPGYLRGTCLFTAVCAFQMANGDLAGSIYRLFKGIPSDAIISSITMYNDALAGVTSVNIGLYDILDFDGVGAIIGTGDQFMTATDINAGTAVTAAARLCTTNLSIANRNQALWQIVGEAEFPPKRAGFDICLTATNKTTATTGNVFVKLDYIRGV